MEIFIASFPSLFLALSCQLHPLSPPTMRSVTRDTVCESLPLKMPDILRYLRMTGQAVGETQDRLAVRFVADRTLKLHGRIDRKCLTLELHCFMTAEAYLPLRLQPSFLWNKKLVTGRAMKARHASDVDPRLIVALQAGFGFRFYSMQRGKMA
jgi:hypothetical protein